MVLKIFDDVAVYINTYLLRFNENDEIRPTSTEVDMICKKYGRLLVMMDSIFSDFHIKRGMATENRVSDLETKLTYFMREWKQMNLNQTPKFHTIIDHAMTQMECADMREDRIERHHLKIERHRAKVSRLRNTTLPVSSQENSTNTLDDRYQ